MVRSSVIRSLVMSLFLVSAPAFGEIIQPPIERNEPFVPLTVAPPSSHLLPTATPTAPKSTLAPTAALPQTTSSAPAPTPAPQLRGYTVECVCKCAGVASQNLCPTQPLSMEGFEYDFSSSPPEIRVVSLGKVCPSEYFHAGTVYMPGEAALGFMVTVDPRFNTCGTFFNGQSCSGYDATGAQRSGNYQGCTVHDRAQMDRMDRESRPRTMERIIY